MGQVNILKIDGIVRLIQIVEGTVTSTFKKPYLEHFLMLTKNRRKNKGYSEKKKGANK